MTKLEEMQIRLSNLIKTMQEHIDSDKLDEAQAVKDEIMKLKVKIEDQIFIDELESEEFRGKSKEIPLNDQTKENASFIRAAIKKISGKPLTEVENALLLPNTTNVNGANGEGYILPQDIQTKINRIVRDSSSFREVLGYMKTTALKGFFPVENLDSLTGLVDFEDGTAGQLANDISFNNVTYALREKAAFIKLSNTLLMLTDNDLVAYIVEVFAKKAVITENAMAVTEIESGKTVKTLADITALKSSLNVDIDPAARKRAVIVTNQDGFDYFDCQTDDNGKYLLQPDPTSATGKILFGLPVKVFSNAQLPSSAPTSSVGGYAPVYYGDLEDGVKFIDLGKTAFAASTEAGFMDNTTIARLIEFVTVKQFDASDRCYMVGKLKICEPTT